MKLSWTVVAAMATRSLVASPVLAEEPSLEAWTLATEDEVSARLDQLGLPLAVHHTEQVLAQVRSYATAGRHGTEDMLGRARVHFPTLEHYLRRYRLPDFLKYVTFVESEVKPLAASPVGAVGLWQLMPATARAYGLVINASIDERRDPNRSSEAAARLLADLYDQFGDWGLALAAYNGGPGRVRRAIRAAGSRALEDISPFLPGETRRYLPKIMAAVYIGTHYDRHGLRPDPPEHAADPFRTLLVCRRLSFNEIAAVTGLRNATLARMNPAIRGSYIPALERGFYLRVPRQHLAAVQELIGRKTPAPSRKGYRYRHTVSAGQQLSSLARAFQVSVEDIQRWNRLPEPEIAVGQVLDLFLGPAFVQNRR